MRKMIGRVAQPFRTANEHRHAWKSQRATKRDAQEAERFARMSPRHQDEVTRTRKRLLD